MNTYGYPNLSTREEETIERLLKARTPCLWLSGDDEELIVHIVRRLAKKLGLHLIEWSHTEGASEVNLAGEVPLKTKLQGSVDIPVLFQNHIIPKVHTKCDETIFVLKDMHVALENPKAVRLIRDVKEYQDEGYHPFIVISPSDTIPRDVARLFRLVTFSLPTKEEFTEYIKSAFIPIIEKVNAIKKEEVYEVPTEDTLNSVSSSLLGLSYKEGDMYLKESLTHLKRLDSAYIHQLKVESIKKLGVIDYIEPTMTFDDIGGCEPLKAWLQEEVAVMTDSARAMGIDTPKGYLALGISGAGKTLMAEGLASLMNVPLLSFSIRKVLSRFVGESEKKITMALSIIKRCAPCVLLLDEVEKLFGGAMSAFSGASDGNVTTRILAELLRFMNDNESGVYVVMTSNDPSSLPPEFTRAGRLDALWYFGLPTKKERRHMLSIFLSKKNLVVEDALFTHLVDNTEHFTGAELRQVIKSLLRILYVRKGKLIPDKESIDDALSEVIPIYESSREKILALESYAKGRARMASKADKDLETEPYMPLGFSL